jgi:glycerate dehydrogenase
MKAVFLDRATFSADVDLPTPAGISDYQVYDATPNDTAVIVERSRDADIIITNKVVLSADVIGQLPKLKLVQIAATGMNNLDQAACANQGIKVMNVAGYADKSVPEHTLMLMLGAMRAINHYHHSVIDGQWQADGKFCLMDQPLYDLEGRTLGIIGYGVIGQRVAEIARAFGMTVLIAERVGQAPRSADYTAFDEVLANADILTLHCPLSPETTHLINHDTIAKMAKRPLLINVARGGVVDSQAVVDAIHQGKLLGYASDVFEQEPMATDDPLMTLATHPRVLFTPHNAWGSANAQRKLWSILAQQVSSFILHHA